MDLCRWCRLHMVILDRSLFDEKSLDSRTFTKFVVLFFFAFAIGRHGPIGDIPLLSMDGAELGGNCPSKHTSIIN